jgi:hypothetical protein
MRQRLFDLPAEQAEEDRERCLVRAREALKP